MVEHKGVAGGFGRGSLGLRAGRGTVTSRCLRRRRRLTTAICAAVERLESRCYFAALAGDSVVDAGKPYVLHLSPGYEENTAKYRVDWGDNTSTTTPDTAARTLTHEYAYDAQNPTRAPKVYRLDSGDNVVGAPYALGFDPTFGSRGWVYTPFWTPQEPTVASYGTTLQPQKDGKTVVAGWSVRPDGSTLYSIARYRADGTLDAKFGPNRNGLIGGTFGGAGANSEVAKVIVQPDGKILVAGTVQSATAGKDLALMRFNADGSVDTTFGTGGTVTTDVAARDQVAYDVALQKNDQILVAGSTATAAGDTDMVVVRYSTYGELDETFGGGDGIVPLDLAGGANDVAVGVDGLRHGKILVGGGVGGSYALVRLNVDGQLDGTFNAQGTPGKSIVMPELWSLATAMDLHIDGEDTMATIAGRGVAADGGWDYTLVRFNPDGTVDSGFGGGDGKLTINPGSLNDIARGIRVQRHDGKILVAGQTSTTEGVKSVVVRVDETGAPDPTFGTNGTLLADVGSSWEWATALGVQLDGRIVAAGTFLDGFSVMRLQPQNTVRVNPGTRPGLSIAPAASGAAGLQVQEHAPFVITLTHGGTAPPDEWVVDWGDGRVQTYPGTAPDAVHAYSDGANTYQVVARAVDVVGSVRVEHPSNALSVTTTLAGLAASTPFIEDGPPSGWTESSWPYQFTWGSSNPAPKSGTLSLQSQVRTGGHHNYGTSGPSVATVGVADVLYANVYLDPASPPRELILWWNAGDGDRKHGAYWGENVIPWGRDATQERWRMGRLPAAGGWVRLEVPASLVGMEGKSILGLEWAMYEGKAALDAVGVAPPATAPAAPTGLVAIARTDRQVRLEWQDRSSDEGAFRVMRSTDGAHFALLAEVTTDSTSFTDSTVAPGARYWYRVESSASAGSRSGIVFADTPTDDSGQTDHATGVWARYYANDALEGQPVQVFEKSLDLNWGRSSPAPGVPSDGFSAEFLGRIKPPHATGAKNYTFRVVADGGVRLTVAGQLLIDNWDDARMPGDANLDGTANFNDMAKLAQNYNQPGSFEWEDADFDGSTGQGINGDFEVALSDLVAYAQNSNKSQQPRELVSNALSLSAGQSYDLRLRLRDQHGFASAKLLWTFTNAAGQTVTQLVPLAQLDMSGDTTAPAPVATVRLDRADATSANISWSNASDDLGVVGYEVHRNDVLHKKTSHLSLAETGLDPLVSYTYKVRAYDAGGNVSAFRQLTVPSLPATPGGLTATPQGAGTIQLDWVDGSSNEDGFVIERSTDGGATYQPLGPVGAGETTYTDTDAPDSFYAYRVKSFNARGASAYASTTPTPDSGAPRIVQHASPSEDPVADGNTVLSVLAEDGGGEAGLTYTWATLGTPPAAVSFSAANGTNAGKNTTATFTAAGTYRFEVTVADAGGLTAKSRTEVVVNHVAGKISGAPFATVGVPYSVQLDGPTDPPVRSWTINWGDGTVDTTGTYTVEAAGAGLRQGGDGIHFIYQTLDGDGEIVARVQGSPDAGEDALAGLMFRQSLDAGARTAFAGLGSAGPTFQWRDGAGAPIGLSARPESTTRAWFKLVRTGGKLTAFVSDDATQWRQIGGTVDVGLSGTAYVGMAVTSGSTTEPISATFDGIRVTAQAAPSGQWTPADVGTPAIPGSSSVDDGDEAAVQHVYQVPASVRTISAKYLDDSSHDGGSFALPVRIDMAAEWKFDETSGLVAADATGNGHAAQLEGGPSFVAGRPGAGNALSLSGSGQFASSDSVVDTSRSFSISAWVRWGGAATFGTVVSQAGRNVTGVALQKDAQGKWRLVMRQADATDAPLAEIQSSGSVVPNQWQHLAATYDAAEGRLKLYVDGVLQGTAGLAQGWEADGPTVIGAYAAPTGSHSDFFDGLLDDLRVYPSALSQGDVWQLAGGSPSSTPQPPTRVRASALSGTEVYVRWVHGGLSAEGYNVYRSTDGTNFTKITSVDSDATAFLDEGVAVNTVYYYRVASYNAAGESARVDAVRPDATSVTQIPTQAQDTRGFYHVLNLNALQSPDSTQTVTSSVDLAETEYFRAGSAAGAVLKALDALAFNQDEGAAYRVGHSGAFEVTSAGDLWLENRYGLAGADYDFNDNWWDVDVVRVPVPLVTVPETTLGEGSLISIDVQLPGASIDWTVDWGDGVEETQTGSPYGPSDHMASHMYSDGASRPNISVSAEYGGGVVQAPPVRIDIIPLAPSGLTATAVSDSQVDLVWTNHSGVATDYKIQRSTDGQNWTVLDVIGREATSYQDGLVDEGAQYHYRVSATTGVHDSPAPNQPTVRLKPASATAMRAAAGSATSVALTWTDNSSAETGYRVEQSPDGENWSIIASLPAGATSHNATGLSANTTYHFRVFALNSAGDAPFAAQTLETTLPAGALPTPAGDLVATVVSAQRVDLAWTDSATGATGYRVERRTGTSDAWETLNVVASGVEAYSDTSAQANQTYAYRIVATNAYGDSEATQLVGATTGLVAPGGLTTSSDALGRVVLNWTDNALNETSFKVWRFEMINGVQEKTLAAEAPANDGTGPVSFLLTEVVPGTAYSFSVAAATGDATSAETAAVPVTPVVKSVSLIGQPTATFGTPYALKLRRAGITAALTWEVDWGDGSVQEVTGTPDANGDLNVSHTYAGPTVAGLSEFTIRATARTATDVYRAEDLTITGTGGPAGAAPVNDAAAKRAVLDVFERVYAQIHYEPYFGLRKGAEATYSTRGGNDWDQAALLKWDLDRDGLPQKYGFSIVYVFGYIDADNKDVMNWLGVKDVDSAVAVLNAGGIKWSVIPGSKIRFLHAWLRLKSVALGWSNADGSGGIDLDPSWKYRELRSNAIQTGNAVTFNQAEFRSQTGDSPLEWYESQVRDFIRDRDDLTGHTSLADLPYQGPIIAKRFTDFPSLSNGAFSFAPVADSQVEFTDHRSVPNIVGVTGNANFTHRLRVNVGSAGITWLVDVPTYASAPITIRYEPGTTSGMVRPVLYVRDENGTEIALAPHVPNPTYQVTTGQALQVTVEAVLPDVAAQVPLFEQFTPMRTFLRTAGDPLALMVDAQQISAVRVSQFQEKLNQLAYQSGIPDLAQYQQQLLGIIALKYAHEAADRRSAVSDLTGVVPVSLAPGFGLITGLRDPDAQDNNLSKRREAFANPFVFYNATQGKGIFVDLPQLQVSPIAIVDANRQQREENATWAIQYILSELESSVLEELLNTESISTAKGFQLAKLDQAKFLHFKPGQTTSDAATSDVVRTVSQLFNGHNDSAAANFRAQLTAQIIGDAQNGIAPADVWIPDDVLSIGPDWTGFVWFSSRNDGDLRYISANIQKYGQGQPSFGGYQVSSTPLVNWSETLLNPQVNSGPVMGDPVNLFTGSLYHDETDISLPNVAFPATFARHYDSLNNDDLGFGKGWTFSYGDFVTESANGNLATWTTSQGQKYEFRKVGKQYDNPAGLFGVFSRTSEGFSYREKDGTTYVFSAKRKDKNGNLIGNGRLLRIADRNGNRISIRHYDAETATPVLRSVSFQPASPNNEAPARALLSFSFPEKKGNQESRKVKDYAGRTWVYNFTHRSDGRYLSSVVSHSSTATNEAAVPLTTEYAYYSGGRRNGLLASITRKVAGKVRGTQTYDYYANRRAFSTTDATGHTEFFSYDLFTTMQLQAKQPVYTHAAYHTDTSGHTTKVEFDSAGLITRTINPDRSRVEQGWTAYVTPTDQNQPSAGQYLLKFRTNEIGLTDFYKYNALGDVTYHLSNSWNFAHIGPATGPKGSGTGIDTSYEYDPQINKGFGGVTAVVVEGSRRTTFLYDNKGNLVRTTDPAKNATRFGYDANGLLKSTTRPKGVVGNQDPNPDYTTTFFYDTQGSGQVTIKTQRLKVGGPDVNVSTVVYDPRGNPTSVTDGTGRKISHEYDILNRKSATIVDPNGFALRTRYTNWDDLVTHVANPLTMATDPSKQDVRSDYDAAGRLTFTTDLKTGARSETRYDPAGNVSKTIDPLGRETRFLYDDRGRLTQTLFADGAFARSLFDGAGRVVAASEPANTVQGYRLDDAATTTTVYGKNGLVSAIVDPVGQKSTFEYNAFGQKSVSRFFTSKNQNTAHVTTNFFYDDLGRLNETRSDTGAITTTAFDKNGNVIETVAYEIGHLMTSGANFLNRKSVKLSTIPQAKRRVTKVDYDVADRAIATTDPMGFIARTEYDDANRVIGVTDPRGAVPVGQAEPNPPTHKTTYTYDAAGRLEVTRLPAVAEDPNRNDTITNTYDALGRLKTVKNARGFLTTYVYDDVARKTSTFDPNNQDVIEIRDKAGQVISVQDRRDNVAKYQYDVRGRLIREELPNPANSGHATPVGTYTYDHAGNLIATESPTGLRTETTYDALHRVVATKAYDLNVAGHPLISSSAQGYANNNLTVVTDGLGYRTRYDYDKAGRQVAGYASVAPSKKAASVQLWKKTYDSLGNLRSETIYPEHGSTATSRTTVFDYDNNNRLIKTIEQDPDRPKRGHPPLVTTYDYDKAGNPKSITDPQGTTSFLYDARNRLKTQTQPDPDGPNQSNQPTPQPIIYEYDPSDNVKKITDPAGNVTTFDYNKLDLPFRETTTAYLNPASPAASVVRGFEYDNNGNLTAAVDRNKRRREFKYDSLDRMTHETWIDPVEGNTIIEFRYDAGGRLLWADSNYTTRPGTTDPTRDFKYTYDALDRVDFYDERTSDTGPGQISFDNDYNANGDLVQQKAKIAGAPDYTNAYSYDHLGSLIAMFQGENGVPGKRVRFGVNQIGQLTSIEQLKNAIRKGRTGVQVPGANRNFDYDSAGNLRAITYPSKSTEYAFTRDQQHRITKFTVDGQSRQFQYYFDDQLSSTPQGALDYDDNHNRTTGGSQTGADNRLKEDSRFAYEYDREGNVVKRIDKSTGTHSDFTDLDDDFVEFVYDHRNRLTDAYFYRFMGPANQGPTQVWSANYIYDAADRMVRRIGPSGGTENYAYAGGGPDLVFVFTGDAIDKGRLKSRYLYGPGDHQVLAEDTPGVLTAAKTQTRWYLADHAGSVRKLLDDNGKFVRKLDYDAFGNVLSNTGLGQAPRHQYTGQIFDPDTGLSYYGARWYDPKPGRFVNQDPIYEGTNPYAYVANDPLNYTDPTGLSASLVGLATGSYTPAGSGLANSIVGDVDTLGILRGYSEFQRYQASLPPEPTPVHYVSQDRIPGPSRSSFNPKPVAFYTSIGATEIPKDLWHRTPGQDRDIWELHQMKKKADVHNQVLADYFNGDITWDDALATGALVKGHEFNIIYATDSPSGQPTAVDTAMLLATGGTSAAVKVVTTVAVGVGAGTVAYDRYRGESWRESLKHGFVNAATVEISGLARRPVRVPAAVTQLPASGAIPNEMIGAATRVNISAQRTLALLKSNGGTGPLRWQVVSRAPKSHGNSLSATGPHQLYAVREMGTGRVLHIGETGQLAKRRSYWRRFFHKLGIDTETIVRKTVDGKAAVKSLETRFIQTYKGIFGKRPPFNKSDH